MRAVLLGRRQRQHRDPARQRRLVDRRPSRCRSSRGAEAEVIARGVSLAEFAGSLHRERAPSRLPMSCLHHGPERSTKSNHEPGLSAASVNGRSCWPSVVAIAARPRRDARQGLVRHQLGRRGRAWRLLPGGRRRHLQEIRPRRHHRAGRPERQQPHAADRRQDRFLHEPRTRCSRSTRSPTTCRSSRSPPSSRRIRRFS